MSSLVEGIPGSGRWKEVEAVPKGWSRDAKYRVLTEDGERLLVRVSHIADYPRKKLEYDALCRLRGLPILMSRPVDFGTFNNGACVFTITTWIDGEDAETALSGFDVTKQYDLGCAAGRILRQIHRISAPSGQPDWAERFNRKIDRNIRNYEACGIEVPGARKAIRHINSLRYLLKGRPQVLQHGDYHCGNMIVTADGQIGIIDFNRLDYGDPWEEFNRIVWCAPVSRYFASGRIDGYFAHPGQSVGDIRTCSDIAVRDRSNVSARVRIPDEFFPLMSLYVASNMLSSVPWAIPFGPKEVDVMLRQAENVLNWYDGFKTYIPRWYGAPHRRKPITGPESWENSR